MAKIWNGVFWGEADVPTPAMADGPAGLRAPVLMSAATVGLVGVTVGRSPCSPARSTTSATGPPRASSTRPAYVQAVLGR